MILIGHFFLLRIWNAINLTQLKGICFLNSVCILQCRYFEISLVIRRNNNPNEPNQYSYKSNAYWLISIILCGRKIKRSKLSRPHPRSVETCCPETINAVLFRYIHWLQVYRLIRRASMVSRGNLCKYNYNPSISLWHVVRKWNMQIYIYPNIGLKMKFPK